MTKDVVSVFAPATVANVGPGFDVLGMAVDAAGDTVRARRTPRGVRLLAVTGTHGLPPADDRNTAVVAAREVLALLGDPFGADLELAKGLPVGSGLGSSGASAAAAAAAVNLLAGSPLAPEDLVAPAARAEAAACGAAHPDNVAPALLGGITLIRPGGGITRIRTRLALAVALVTPRLSLSTREARAAIPPEIPLADAVSNAAHLASLVYALATDDLALLRRSIEDRIAEPRRAHLIPGFAEVKRAALDAGALGASISGAGPTVFALCEDRAHAEPVRAAMSAALARAFGEHSSSVASVREAGAGPVGADPRGVQ